MRAHRAREPHDLGFALPFRAERDEQSRDLRIRGGAAHDPLQCIGGLLDRQVLPLQTFLDVLFHESPSTQFLRICMPSVRQDRFGMELHAFDRQRPVPHAHDHAIVGLRRDLQFIGQRGALDDQRVIARRIERIRHTLVQRGPVMPHARCPSVHQRRRMDDGPAERRADGLMAEADAEQRERCAAVRG